MPYWGDGTKWDSQARWAPAAPQIRKHKTMANIAINTNGIPIPAKIVKGQEIITMSTNNPNVPGNTAALTAFSNAQADLIAANDAYETARQSLANLLSVRNDALATWNTSLNGLAGVTQSITQGDRTKILSTGFDVRSAPTPPPPASAPGPITVKLNGTPGVSKLSWPRVQDAKSYIVEQSPDPITGTSWEQVDTPTKASCAIPGAEPGKLIWFRVAAVGANGTSPWSGPASRPVM